MSECEAMILSAALEAIVAFAIAHFRAWPCRGAIHVGAASAIATFVTHPQFWNAALFAYDRYGIWPSLAALEAIVVLVEGALIAWMASLRLDHAMLVSLAANAASFALGLALSGGAFDVSAVTRIGISIQA